MSTDTDDQVRQLIRDGLARTPFPDDLAGRSARAGRRALRRRRVATAFMAGTGVVAVLIGVALHPWTQPDSNVQVVGGAAAPARPGPGASNRQLQAEAQGYALDRLGVSISRTLGSRRGGECAVYDLLDAHGTSHRVVLILQGDAPAYEPVYLSQSFRLQQFVPDSDDACGMRNSGNLRRVSDDGTEVPIGPP